MEEPQSTIQSTSDLEHKNNILDIIERNIENYEGITKDDFYKLSKEAGEDETKTHTIWKEDVRDNYDWLIILGTQIESYVSYILTKYLCDICDNIECPDLSLGGDNMINDDIFFRKFSLENDVVFGYCHFFNNKFVMKLQPKTLVKDSLCKLKDYLYFNSIHCITCVCGQHGLAAAIFSQRTQ